MACSPDHANREVASAADGTLPGDMSTTEPRVEVRTDRRSVLPWRRHTVAIEVAPLVARYRERHRRMDSALIERAFAMARDAHAQQVRRSGEPYITHPLG